MVMTGLADQAAKACTGSQQGKNLRMLGLLLLGVCVSSVLAQPARTQEKPSPSATGPSAASHPAAVATIPNAVTSGRQAMTLRRLWGIEDVHVRYTASGEMVRFSYRIVDAEKAKMLNEKKNEPYMVVLKTGAKLAVPETEKVGKLRQTAAPKNGREYWMVFTNTGRLVQPGDHVDIVIGTFRANELVVESSGPTPRAQKP